MITIPQITEQIRRVVDPQIIKLRQELYGSDTVFGVYIAEIKIPPSIARHGENVNGISGEGLKSRFTLWTDKKQLTYSNLYNYAPSGQIGGIYLASGHLYIGIPVSGALTEGMNIYAAGFLGSFAQISATYVDTVMKAGKQADDYIFNVENGNIRVKVSEPGNSTTTSNLVIDDNGQVYKKSASSAGLTTVPQRFGWYIDGIIEPGEGVGPVFMINTAADVVEVSSFIREPGPLSIVFKVEYTDNYNPYFVTNGFTPSWYTLGSIITIPGNLNYYRYSFNPNIELMSRNAAGQGLGQGIVPSGDYGVWFRLTVISGGSAEGLTTHLLIRSKGTI